MNAEPFPLKYGAMHDPDECACCVLKRPRLRRTRAKHFDWMIELLKEKQWSPPYVTVINVEERLYWVLCSACKRQQDKAQDKAGGRLVRLDVGGWEAEEEYYPSQPTTSIPPTQASTHWSDNPGRGAGSGGFMG
ncbi:hypothetical protein [Streptomyces sp. NPDC058620]|uniref:hypothetical protein n=1 Tax=Streptomyces sp. NPDC058620 TaxID=3346560 RepID=UPI0036600C5B